ncbi:hypothetical protein [Flavimaricola marinus]|uniref:Uncharacterized protein n=1 Tax=Flavimaricola marinus TaxID=1819565 RepID=A0A238LKW6_9RHOB|nr:hypothetical protein [Flavimaricola marinus]SMY10357.1 hypothetical protein LOM8899_04532 [Flavimaricola marinus]
MSDFGKGHIETARANLLLKISNERKLGAERLAKHEYRTLMAELEREEFLFPNGNDQPPDQKGFRSPDPAVHNAMHAGLAPLSIPLGSIATFDQPGNLPGIGLLISDAHSDTVKRALISFFDEHHSRPFCRPLFLVKRLEILPFFRRFELAAYAEQLGWNKRTLKLVSQRHNLDQIRDLIDGTRIHQSQNLNAVSSGVKY